MNESISIKEGNIGRKIAPVDKLKINTEGDNESLWVPAERGNTGVLYASENGIYIASEDGYESYSEVVVRVTEESFYGDKDFDNWNYEVPTDFPDLWDSLTLDGFNIDPLAFDDLFNNKDVWDMDIPDLPDKLDFKMKDLKTKKPKKEKITGIDPVSGNEMAVGLDNFGRLTEQILPTSIKIIKPPKKLVYNNGDNIIFSGLVVQAYTANGNIWTDDSYPNGIIPINELYFPVTVANGGSVNGSKKVTSKISKSNIIIGNSAVEKNSELYKGEISVYITRTYTGANVYATTLYRNIQREGYNNPGDMLIILVASPTPFILTETTHYDLVNPDFDDGDRSYSYTRTCEYTYNNKTVYWICVPIWFVGGFEGEYYTGGTYSPSDSNLPLHMSETVGGALDNSPSSPYRKDAWTMLYGDIGMEVPVQWSRPGDGLPLNDSFNITIGDGRSDWSEETSEKPEETQAINYNGTRYVSNEDVNAEAHYQSGTVWIRGEGKVWSVQDAVAFGLLKPEEEKDGGSDSGSEHEGGHF